MNYLLSFLCAALVANGTAFSQPAGLNGKPASPAVMNRVVRFDVAGARFRMLPELYVAKLAESNMQITYRIIFVDAAPLRYDFDKSVFEGTLRFIPVEIAGTGTGKPVSKRLSVPEDILVSFGSATIPLQITRVNWPPVDITVTAADPKDSLEVKVLTAHNPSGYPQFLPVEPAVILTSGRTAVQGMGIQAVPVHVALKGVSSKTPVGIALETSKGTILPGTLEVTGEGPREAVLRPEGIGAIEVRAVNPNFHSNRVTVSALFPWLFLVLAVAGGLIGGLGKTLLSREQVTPKLLLLGSITGLVAAVAYWGLGITLLGFVVETRGLNEAMVFGFGLIAGYFGLKFSGK